jgi:hypothetical protein
MTQRRSAEGRDVHSRADGAPDCVHLLCNFTELDRLLGEHRARTGFTLGRVLPLFLNLSDRAADWFSIAAREFQQHLAVVLGPPMEQNIFENGFHEFLGTRRHRY